LFCDSAITVLFTTCPDFIRVARTFLARLPPTFVSFSFPLQNL
jgi:hypothetical protein